jgi:hypothetical protein
MRYKQIDSNEKVIGIQHDYFLVILIMWVLLDHMVVWYTATYAISAYHHWSCEFESHSGEVNSIQHYVIKFVSDLRQLSGFLRALQVLPPMKLTAMI